MLRCNTCGSGCSVVLTYPAISEGHPIDHFIVATVQEALQVWLDDRHDALFVSIAPTTDEWGNEDILHIPKRVRWRQRGLLEHIQPCSGDLAFPQRLHQGSFVHHAAARDIDEIGGRLHD